MGYSKCVDEWGQGQGNSILYYYSNSGRKEKVMTDESQMRREGYGGRLMGRHSILMGKVFSFIQNVMPLCLFSVRRKHYEEGRNREEEKNLYSSLFIHYSAHSSLPTILYSLYSLPLHSE